MFSLPQLDYPFTLPTLATRLLLQSALPTVARLGAMHAYTAELVQCQWIVPHYQR